MLRVENVAEGVGALVAEVGGVGKLADAEGVADDDDCAVHGERLLHFPPAPGAEAGAGTGAGAHRYVRCSCTRGRAFGWSSPNSTNDKYLFVSSHSSRDPAPN